MKQAESIDFNDYKNRPEILKKIFFEDYWEKKPLIIRNFFDPAPVINDIFSDLDECQQDELLKANIRGKVRGSLGHSLLDLTLDENLKKYLPHKNTQTFFEQVKKLEGLEEFFIYFPSLSYNSVSAWKLSLPLLKEVIQQTALPMKGFDIDLFWGCYKETPTMIHKDSASLKFLLAGEKSMLVWPPSAFEVSDCPPEELKFKSNYFLYKKVDAESLSSSTVLKGKPGDALYWPSTYWHISHNEDSCFKMSATLAWFQAVDLTKMVSPEKLKKKFFPAIPGGSKTLFMKEVQDTFHVEKMSEEELQKVYDKFYSQSSTLGVEFPPFVNFSREVTLTQVIEWGLVAIDTTNSRLFLNGGSREFSLKALHALESMKAERRIISINQFKEQMLLFAEKKEVDTLLDFFKERRVFL